MIPKNSDIRFEVTTRCNYNCIICPRDKLLRKVETMDLALFKRLLDKILKSTGQYTTVSFPGMGEPLLDGSLERKVRYAKGKGLNVLILTNGFFLTVKKFKRLEDMGVRSIRVSFYGDSPEGYARMHGVNGGAFKKTRDNLEAIAKIKRHSKLLLTLNVLEEVNSGFVKGWIEYWNDKADLLEVWRPHNWVSGRDYRTIQGEQLKTCGRPFKGPLQVQVDGTVNMCCFDFNGELTLGDLKRQSLNEIFSSPMYRRISSCHKTGNFKNSGLICEHCDQRNSNKSDVMIYSSKFAIEKRVLKTSTLYSDLV